MAFSFYNLDQAKDVVLARFHSAQKYEGRDIIVDSDLAALRPPMLSGECFRQALGALVTDGLVIRDEGEIPSGYCSYGSAETKSPQRYFQISDTGRDRIEQFLKVGDKFITEHYIKPEELSQAQGAA